MPVSVTPACPRCKVLVGLKLLSAIALALTLGSCVAETERKVPGGGGEAYVGPMSLPLRAELSPKSAAASSVQHGERVQVVQRRRRFAKIRARSGAEGWVDARQLMRPDQIDDLRRLWTLAANMPSMGAATVWDKLNIHTQPNRLAPSFDQIPEQGRVEVLWQVVVPKTGYNDPGIDLPEPKKIPKSKPKAKEKKDPKGGPLPPLPPPPAPTPPDNWLDLSKSAMPEDLAAEPNADPDPEPPPVQLEDWTLVRTKDGKAGWVVTRSLNLAIPDEVAQYAEGRRITSYFALNDVPDGEQKRHDWLWTTLSGKHKDYQFDSFRVFIWNTRRHRYETAYIERNVTGYFPVELKTVDVTEGKQTNKAPGFSLLLEEKDGNLLKKTYAFQGYRVRLVDKAPAQRPNPLADLQPRKDLAQASVPPSERGLLLRLQDRAGELKRRMFGQ